MAVCAGAPRRARSADRDHDRRLQGADAAAEHAAERDQDPLVLLEDAAQHALDIEKEKLDLLKQQSKELDAQAKAREAAFNQALGATDPNNGYSQFAQEQMVDPTTEEGKAKIEQMRRTLSKEDFQNWIEWQRKLWDQRHDAEKSALDVQAEAEQNAVDAAPPHQYSPAVPLTCVLATSRVMAKPRPKPTPE